MTFNQLQEKLVLTKGNALHSSYVLEKRTLILLLFFVLDGFSNYLLASSQLHAWVSSCKSRVVVAAMPYYGSYCQRAYSSTRTPLRVHNAGYSSNTNIIRRFGNPLIRSNEFPQKSANDFSENELALIPEAPPVPVHSAKSTKEKNNSSSSPQSRKHSIIQLHLESIDFDNLVIPPPPDPLPLTPKEIRKRDELAQKEMESLKHRNLMEAYPLNGSSIAFLSAVSFVQLFIKYVFVDLEFTGLGDLHKITELGAVKTQGFVPTGDKFNTLINPQRSVNSYAHKITGYTQKQLSKHPTFAEIYDNFLYFTKESALVFHYGHNDLKYLKREIEQANGPQSPFQSNLVIDTFPILQKIFYDGKKSLSAVAEEYGVDVSMRVLHGALLDAEILADVFRAMLRKHGLQIFLPEQWEGCGHQHVRGVFETFLPLQNIKALEILKKYGIALALPKECRVAPRVYHLGLGKPCDAIAVDFSGDEKGPCKMLMSYFVPEGFKNTFGNKENPSYKKKQMFFGWYERETISFIDGPRQTVFIGGLRGSLLAREVLQGERGSEVLNKLGIEDKTFSVLACPSIYLLHMIGFPYETKNIFLLLDNFDKNDDLLKGSLKECVNKHCVRNFLPLLKVSASEASLLRFTVKYAGYDWTVMEDQKASKSRILLLERNPQQRASLELDEYHQIIKIDENIIPDPATQVLVSSSPEVSLRIIAFHYEKGGEMTLTDKLPHSISHYADRMLQALGMNSVKDVTFIDRVERARVTYERAEPITLDSPACQYLKKRGITCSLPTSFRTAADVYHPWLNRYFHAIIMPLMDIDSKMIGIHQIFFEQDGTPLKIQRNQGEKIPNKVSLGKTVGGVTEIYRSHIGINNEVDVTLVSEGGENALVVKDTLDYLKDKNPVIFNGIMHHFGSKNMLNIKSCVGINGIVDVPLEKSTHTVVILADNDAANVDAKKTVIDTVRKFLECGVNVHIVLPKAKDGQIKKIDLNDLYIECLDKKYEEIVHVLFSSVIIKSVEDLGHPEEPLQKSLEKFVIPPVHDVSLRDALSKFYKEPQSSSIASLGTFVKEVRRPPNRALYKINPRLLNAHSQEILPGHSKPIFPTAPESASHKK